MFFCFIGATDIVIGAFVVAVLNFDFFSFLLLMCLLLLLLLMFLLWFVYLIIAQHGKYKTHVMEGGQKR